MVRGCMLCLYLSRVPSRHLEGEQGAGGREPQAMADGQLGNQHSGIGAPAGRRMINLPFTSAPASWVQDQRARAQEESRVWTTGVWMTGVEQ